MSVQYLLNNITVPGVQTSWERIIKRVNSDGSIIYSPWLNHIWRIGELELDIWNALQVYEGQIIGAINSNDIEKANNGFVYFNCIFESLNGVAVGHLMTNVELKLNVNLVDSTVPWWLPFDLTATPLVVYQPKGEIDLTKSYINLINPGVNDAVPLTTAPTLVAQGWQLDSGRAMNSTVVLPDEYSVFVRSINPAVNPTGAIFGVDGTKIVKVTTRSQPATVVRVEFTHGSDFDSNNFGLGLSDDVFFTYATSPGIVANNFNSSVVGPTSIAESGITIPLYLGAVNNNGTTADALPQTIVAVAIYSGLMTRVQAADIFAAMAAL